MRVDKWLWAARFFKTRSIAATEIQKGRVSVNGQRIKPSRTIQPGDRVTVQKPPYQFEVDVLGLNEQRRPAVEAQQLYKETESSLTRREELAATLRVERMASGGLRGEGRPSKRQRRQIIRFRNQSDVSDDKND